MNRDLLALQVLYCLDVAVGINKDRLTADMRSCNEGHVYSVGHRYEHRCNVVGAPHTLSGPDSRHNRISFHISGIDTVLFIVSLHFRHIFCRHTGSAVEQIVYLRTEYRFLLHSLPIFFGNSFRTFCVRLCAVVLAFALGLSFCRIILACRLSRCPAGSQ